METNMQDANHDFTDFFKAAEAADLALTGILGDDLSEDDADLIGDAMAKLTEAKRLVSAVQVRQQAKHADR